MATDGSNANAGGDRLEVLVERMLEQDDGTLTVTATLDLTPDGSGQPPVLRALRQAAREASEGLDRDRADAVAAEVEAIEAAAADASERGVLGLVWVAHPSEDDDAPLTVLELAAPIRTSLHAATMPYVFEVARAAYLDRPVSLVTCDLHTMDVARVRTGAATDEAGVDWPAHYLSKVGQRTGRDARGGGTAGGEGGPGHSYATTQRYVEEQRNLFANEAGEHLAKFVQPEDLLVVEGVDEARQQLLARLPEAMAERAVQLNAADPTEDERDRFARLTALAERAQLENAAARAEAWFGGETPNGISGIEAIAEACEQGRIATVIVHQDAAEHFGTAEDMRLHRPPEGIDADAVERTLQAALRQGALAVFADDERLLERGGMVAIARY